MIDAYVSGQAARVALVEGTEVHFLDADNPSKHHRIDASDLTLVFGGATDVEFVRVKKPEDTFQLLLVKFEFDRFLNLFDIFLSEDLSQPLRREAAVACDALLSNVDVAQRAENLLFAKSLPELTPEAIGLSLGLTTLSATLGRLSSARNEIDLVTAALRKALSFANIDQRERDKIESIAITTGLVRDCVLGRLDPSKMGEAAFHSYATLSGQRDGRAIVQRWIGSISSKEARPKLINASEDDLSDTDGALEVKSGQPSFGAFQAVMAQQDAILARLANHDIAAARRFADDLVKSQLQTSEPEYAARSLSNLAIKARRLGQRSVELEWAKAATELSPTDAKAFSLLADTYLDLFRVSEADEAFRTAIELGEREFGQVGVARTLRVAGQPQKALEVLSSVLAEHEGSETLSRAWVIAGDVARELGEHEQALRYYESGLADYPADASLWYGKGSALRESGRLDEAIAWLNNAIRMFPNDHVPHSILAEAYGDAGRFDVSLQVYQRAKDRFPEASAIWSGLAEAMASAGDFEGAITLYADAKSLFPSESTVFCGYADILRKAQQFDASLAAYDEAVAAFPLDPVARDGRANLLKTVGRLTDALGEYDKNVRDFPFDLVALSSRSNLLKLLGQHSDALKSYDLLIERRPDYVRARYGKAAVYLAIGQFAEAYALLPETAPVSEEDWFAYYLRGLGSLKRGHVEEAMSVFRLGATKAPSLRRRHFDAALAAAMMREHRYQAAADVLARSRETADKILRARCFVELGQFDEATSVLHAANDNTIPAVIEYAANLIRFIATPRLETRARLEMMETEILLLAA